VVELLAKVVRPSTDPEIFGYLQPLIKESLKALDALPSDGPGDPKLLMRVDWGTGEPLLRQAPGRAAADDASATDGSSGGAKGGGSLKRAIVMRASSMGPPQKKLKRAMEQYGVAQLSGPGSHFINEVAATHAYC
jgi:hypothetical protein